MFALSFLTSPLGKLASVALLIVAAVIGFRIWLSAHDRALVVEAQREWEAAQIIQLEQDRQRFAEQLRLVREEEEAIRARLEAERDALKTHTRELVARIRRGEFGGSTDESSPVLKETLRALQQRTEGE